ncbi:S66 family peptidase [Pseudoalteromonas sp. S16_S37]|uniref:S66 family peptidase n=1 Tax=Pseudoalteromonas sp. S16_S37 TaxID=2720228 RepID=UPI001680D67B|nr:S66 peptidase family protein [Pseudoalteromonas sp. S16_S37]MBD1584309.1 LD-carboxypeptidase [Pseudoalteromonas sp. S16_S37]
MIKPSCLSEKSTLAIVSPSWGGPSEFPHIYQKGLQNLKALGFNIIEYPSATMDDKALFQNPKLRSDDINAAFKNPEVDGIIATIGGSDSARILKYLDIENIKKNPKLFMGFSDTTSITTTLNQAGLVTFNGPSVMAGFAQLHNFDSEYQNYIRRFLTCNPNIQQLPTFDLYSHGYPDWTDSENTGKRSELLKSRGPQVLQGNKPVTGRLFGGCIEVLEMLKGTQYWPSADFWQNKILFLETSQEKPSIDYVRYWLRNYGVMGVFDKLSALLIGRPRDYSEEEQKQLEDTIISVVKEEFGNEQLAIIANLDFGHTDPQVILPLGIECQVDTSSGKLTLLEHVFI